jgi:predicted cupin superfamily sugar epimerase
MDIGRGQRPQLIIPRGSWQAASSQSGWVLASNIVAPAFDFKSLELAPAGFEPGFGI